MKLRRDSSGRASAVVEGALMPGDIGIGRAPT
jgi:hypothetical protein